MVVEVVAESPSVIAEDTTIRDTRGQFRTRLLSYQLDDDGYAYITVLERPPEPRPRRFDRIRALAESADVTFTVVPSKQTPRFGWR